MDLDERDVSVEQNPYWEHEHCPLLTFLVCREATPKGLRVLEDHSASHVLHPCDVQISGFNPYQATAVNWDVSYHILPNSDLIEENGWNCQLTLIANKSTHLAGCSVRLSAKGKSQFQIGSLFTSNSTMCSAKTPLRMRQSMELFLSHYTTAVKQITRVYLHMGNTSSSPYLCVLV